MYFIYYIFTLLLYICIYIYIYIYYICIIYLYIQYIAQYTYIHIHSDHFPPTILYNFLPPTCTTPTFPRLPSFIFAQNLLGKMTYEKQSDIARYGLARTNSPVGRSDDQEPQISYRFGIKQKQTNEHLVRIKCTVQDF